MSYRRRSVGSGSTVKRSVSMRGESVRVKRASWVMVCRLQIKSEGLRLSRIDPYP